MKKKLLNNLGLKLLSIICAIVLWIVAMNVSDYQMTVEIDDIPVEQLNGEVLEELDQIYDVAKGDTVDITVRGKRSVVENLTAADFTATADLSTMSITNTVQIFVAPKQGGLKDDITITCKDNTMVLNLEDRVSVQFSIQVNSLGSPKDGYAVGGSHTTPNIITIEGPKSAVDKITNVMVDVNVDGRDSSFERTTDVKIYDAYGEKIENDKLILSQKSVTAGVDIYPVKSIPININVKGVPEDGYGVSGIIYQPQTIQIAGEESDLLKISKLDIENISVSGLNKNHETFVNLYEYLPDGVVLAQSNSDVAITIVIEKLGEKSLKPTVRDFTLTGKQDGYTYAISLSDDFKLVASGLDSVLDNVKLSDFKPTINCSDLSVGDNNDVKVTLSNVKDVTCEIEGHVTVNVKRN